MEKPEVKPRDWIEIGKRDAMGFAKEAVVSQVYQETSWADLAAVYLNQGKAIEEDFVWKDDHWEFKIQGPNGLYADKNARLSEFVAILRSKKHWK